MQIRRSKAKSGAQQRSPRPALSRFLSYLPFFFPSFFPGFFMTILRNVLVHIHSPRTRRFFYTSIRHPSQVKNEAFTRKMLVGREVVRSISRYAFPPEQRCNFIPTRTSVATAVKELLLGSAVLPAKNVWDPS